MVRGAHDPDERALSRHPLTWILPLSAAISLLLVWLIYFKDAPPSGPPWVASLPALNALLNSLSAACLVAGFVHIKRKRQRAHMTFMLAAIGFSALFLVSYVTYHHYHGDTPFLGQGPIRPVYFFVLISHILLSIVGLPMVLSTLFFALTSRFQRHRRIARFTLPVWLYVSVTGVLVFLILHAYT